MVKDLPLGSTSAEQPQLSLWQDVSMSQQVIYFDINYHLVKRITCHDSQNQCQNSLSSNESILTFDK